MQPRSATNLAGHPTHNPTGTPKQRKHATNKLLNRKPTQKMNPFPKQEFNGKNTNNKSPHTNKPNQTKAFRKGNPPKQRFQKRTQKSLSEKEPHPKEKSFSGKDTQPKKALRKGTPPQKAFRKRNSDTRPKRLPQKVPHPKTVFRKGHPTRKRQSEKEPHPKKSVS